MKLTTADQREMVLRSIVTAAVAGMLIIVLGSGTSVAAGGRQDFTFELPAGSACDGFAVSVAVSGGNQIVREFRDTNGNVVRTLSAGTGSALTFTNLSNGVTFSSTSNGAVGRATKNTDGSTTWTRMGHNVLILFPSDVPTGPSTTLIVGRFVYTVDSNEVFKLEEVSGHTTDICAILL